MTGSRLRDLEKRLEKEPHNLGLRVTVAGMLREAGRSVEAVELYRSVALAYRDQGRPQQAIAVCRSILEIAPDDAACQGLLAQLAPPPRGSEKVIESPAIELEAGTPPPGTNPGIERLTPDPRRSIATPLPGAVPYHVADPTSGVALLTPTDAGVARAATGDDDSLDDTHPGEPVAEPEPGLGNAARKIAGMIAGVDALDLAAELETRKRPRVEPSQLEKVVNQPLPTAPVERLDLDDMVTPAVAQGALPRPRDSEEELTQPREKLPGHDGDDETR